MVRWILILGILFGTNCFNSLAADRYWVATTSSNWNNNSNWSTSSGGTGGASVPGVADIARFNSASTGICTIDIPVTISGINMATSYVSQIDANGNSLTINGNNNSLFRGGSILDGIGTSTITLTLGLTVTISSITISPDLNITSESVLISSSIFNGEVTINKTGSNHNVSSGGSTFNSNVNITNSSSANLFFSNTVMDDFRSNCTINNTGTGQVYFSNAPGTIVTGNLTITNTATGSIGRVYVANNAVATLSVLGNTSITNASSAATSYVYLGGNGDVNLTGNLSIINMSSGITRGTVYVANNATSSVVISGTTSALNVGSAGNNLIYLGNNGDITFHSTLNLTNSPTANRGYIYLHHNDDSNNTYNDDINITNNTSSAIGVYFGHSNGKGRLADGKTFLIGTFTTGQLILKEFTQTAATAHSITLTDSARLNLRNTTWNGVITGIAPRIELFTNVFNEVTYFEKTGKSGDVIDGGNTFNKEVTYKNSGSSNITIGNNVYDTYADNLNLINSGSYRILFVRNGLGHLIQGDLNITDNTSGLTSDARIYVTHANGASLTINGNVTINSNCTGFKSRIYFASKGSTVIHGNLTINNSSTPTHTGSILVANSSSSLLTVHGNTEILNTGTSNTTNITLGVNGDIIFTGTVTLLNRATSNKNFIHLNLNSASQNIYNSNIIVESTIINSDGVRFGNSGGKGTFSSGVTIAPNANGFTRGTLLLKGITQLGTTAQNLSFTVNGAIQSINSTWNGNVNFIAPHIRLSGNTFNGTASFTKVTGGIDNSGGGNLYNDNFSFTNNAGSAARLAYTNGNTYKKEARFIQTGNGNLRPAYNAVSSFEGDLYFSAPLSTQFTMGVNNGSVLFTGNNVQNLNNDAVSNELIIERLEMNKSNGDLIMNLPLTVNGSATFTNGNIQTTTTNLLTISDNAIVSGANDNSYIDGPILKMGNDAFEFPVGKDGNFRSISISAPGNTGAGFRAEYFSADPGATYDPELKDASINHVSDIEYWLLDRLILTENVAVSLSWDETSGATTASNLCDLKVARWNGVMWKDHGNGGVIGDENTGSLVTGSGCSTVAAVTDFSPFTLAAAVPSLILPVTLSSFEVIKKENTTQVLWTTSSEINNDYFEIERSINGLDFEKIGEIKGAGNSTNSIEYQFIDDLPTVGINYYRLKQIDYDGAYEYSQIGAVEFETTHVFAEAGVSGNGDIVFRSPVPAGSLQVFDAKGSVVQKINTNGEAYQYSLMELHQGIYFYNIILNNGVVTSKGKFVLAN